MLWASSGLVLGRALRFRAACSRAGSGAGSGVPRTASGVYNEAVCAKSYCCWERGQFHGMLNLGLIVAAPEPYLKELDAGLEKRWSGK